jgi:superfamily II DNA or RNA helicase
MAALRAGQTVSWRSLDWEVVAVEDTNVLLTPTQPEMASVLGEVRLRTEITPESSLEIKAEGQELVLPETRKAEDWNPEPIRWKFLDAMRFQPASPSSLLWSGAVPIQRLHRQLLPLSHALTQTHPRLLIADDVGLGKTTEAGLIIAELLARKKAGRVLVLAPAHLAKRKWERELNRRFGLCFHRVDSRGFLNLIQHRRLAADDNPFSYTDRLLLSLDYAKEPHIRRQLTELEWDLVVIDECHRVANRATSQASAALRHRLARELAKKTKGLCLLSGTPHDGDDHSFASLIELLATANDLVPKPSLPVVVRRLRREVSPEERLLSAKPEFHFFEPTEAWIDLAKALSTLLTEARKARVFGIDLFVVNVFKRFLSSAYAVGTTLGFVDADSAGSDGDDDPEATIRSRYFVDALKEEKTLVPLFDDCKKAWSKLHGKDPKLQWLDAFLAQVPPNENQIIFTEYEDTARAMTRHLTGGETGRTRDGRTVFLVSGGEEANTTQSLQRFHRSKGAILVTTDTLSEGVDLQENCHRLLHFDLPFRPYRIEQRNGRVDRMGQTKAPIIGLLAANEIALQREIHNELVRKALGVCRLYRFLNNQREALGSLVPVLESTKSLRGRSEVAFFDDIDDIVASVEQTPVAGDVTPANAGAPERKKVGAFEYLLDRRTAVPELTWDRQSGDLGFPSTLRESLARVFPVFAAFARAFSNIQVSQHGVLSGPGLGELLKELYPASSENVEALTLRIHQDCVNEESAECLGWGHELWQDFKSAFHWQASRQGQWHAIPNVALSPLPSAEPLLLAVTESAEGGAVVALTEKGGSWTPIPEDRAKQLLFEELCELRHPRKPKAEPTAHTLEAIRNGFATLVALVQGKRLVGMLYRAPNQRGAP